MLNRLNLKRIIQILFSLTVLLFSVGYLYQLWIFGISGQFDEILRQHFLATVGLPLSAMASASLVSIFEIQSGPIEFAGFGLKFSGSAGQIIMWVICFLAIVSALKILW